MNPNNITSPPQRYRAVHFDGTISDEVLDLGFGVGGVKVVNVIVRGIRRSWFVGEDCHPPDLSTGHYDADGKELFGGDVCDTYNSIGVVCWMDGCFCVRYVIKPDKRRGYETEGAVHLALYWQGSAPQVIGNIHNPAALPEEVRRMLDD